LSYPPESLNLIAIKTAIKIAEKENNTPTRSQCSCQEKGLHNLSGFSILSLPHYSVKFLEKPVLFNDNKKIKS